MPESQLRIKSQPDFVLPAGFSSSYDGLWQIEIDGEEPFDTTGDYILFAGMTGTGSLTLWCDISMEFFAVE